jgi:hypothetical protein
MQFILAILYAVFGLILAIPYCLMAGWSMENYAIVAFVAPAFLFIWLIMGTLAHIFETGHRGRFPIRFDWRVAFGISKGNGLEGSKILFWFWTAYCLLPIISHWGSKLIEIFGFHSLSEIISTHRYSTPLFAFLATLFLAALLIFVEIATDLIKESWRKLKYR